MSNTSQLQKTAGIHLSGTSNIKEMTKEKTETPDPFLTKIFGEYEFYRYGVISMLIIVVVCLGGIGVAMGAMSSALEVSLLIVPTLATVAFVLAVAPMRWILYTGMISSTISILIILYHIIAA